ncbi:MAG: glycoside hydrolase family 99-like domain-containing protein [Lachnospiraceae bacterium]|nr:glycoside hydrolase family 99-like domain-containing protein [Lachnospiraceae bacterium]
MKIISLYLPQFHEIPENNEWWGEGFTEWANVKSASPLFDGHVQPKVPLNKNYYNLLDDEVKIWQAEMAKRYGVYGFCYYHYWFSGKLLLEKPMEQMLKNPKIDLPFCICWANEQWSKQWVGENKILMPQVYGSKDEWIAHFNYFLKFFMDSRYIKDGNKPMLVILHPETIGCLNEMLDCWIELAKINGFDGINFGYYTNWSELVGGKVDDSRFTYDIHGEPRYALAKYNKNDHPLIRKTVNKLSAFVERKTGYNLKSLSPVKLTANRINYDEIWEKLLEEEPKSEKSVPGAFVNWDNAPRYKEKSRVFVGGTPEKFEKYMTKLIKRTKDVYKQDYIFMFAWNEWCEGGYLEPDEENGYGYLQAIKNALEANGEKV